MPFHSLLNTDAKVKQSIFREHSNSSCFLLPLSIKHTSAWVVCNNNANWYSICYGGSTKGKFKPVHCTYERDENCHGRHTFPRLSYTQAHLVLLAHWLCAAKWGEVWRELITIEGECTVARDPLKRVQHLTAEEGYSGNDKRHNNNYVTLNKQFTNNRLIILSQLQRFVVLVNKILA